jgi:hypothetical protein
MNTSIALRVTTNMAYEIKTGQHHKVPQNNYPKPPMPENKTTHAYAIDQKWLDKRLDLLERSRALRRLGRT